MNFCRLTLGTVAVLTAGVCLAQSMPPSVPLLAGTSLETVGDASRQSGVLDASRVAGATARVMDNASASTLPDPHALQVSSRPDVQGSQWSATGFSNPKFNTPSYPKSAVSATGLASSSLANPATSTSLPTLNGSRLDFTIPIGPHSADRNRSDLQQLGTAPVSNASLTPGDKSHDVSQSKLSTGVVAVDSAELTIWLGPPPVTENHQGYQIGEMTIRPKTPTNSSSFAALSSGIPQPLSAFQNLDRDPSTADWVQKERDRKRIRLEFETGRVRPLSEEIRDTMDDTSESIYRDRLAAEKTISDREGKVGSLDDLKALRFGKSVHDSTHSGSTRKSLVHSSSDDSE